MAVLFLLASGGLQCAVVKSRRVRDSSGNPFCGSLRKTIGAKAHRPTGCSVGRTPKKIKHITRAT